MNRRPADKEPGKPEKSLWFSCFWLLWVLSIPIISLLSFIPIVNTAMRITILGLFTIFLSGIFVFAIKRNCYKKVFWIGGIIIFILIAFPKPNFNKEKLVKENLEALKSFKGTKYVWGGETRSGIDCSGLIRQGYIKACLYRGFVDLDFALVKESFQVWFNDCTALELMNGYRGHTKRIFEAQAINQIPEKMLYPGDLAVTADGIHILAYLGSSEWIEADPVEMKVIIVKAPDNKNNWFKQPVWIIRWSVFSE